MQAVKHKWTANSQLFRKDNLLDGRKSFVLEVGLGAINYYDGMEFQEIDTTPVINDDGTHRWEINKAPYKCRISRRGRRRIWPDRNRPGKYITIGVPVFLNSDGDVLGKGWRWRKGDIEVKMDFGNTRCSFDIILHSDQGISEVTFPFVRNNISKAAAKKLLRLVLYDSSEERIERPIQAVIRDNLVKLSWDATGMVYPITIDPTIDVEVGAASNNDISYIGAGVFLTQPSFIGDSGGTSVGHGSRFPNVTIPKDATIDTADITWNASHSGSGTVVRTVINGELAVDAVVFTNASNYFGRVRTTAVVAWEGLPTWVINTAHTTPEIKSTIQEIVEQGLWESGNALVVFVTNNGSDANALRRGDSYDSDSSNVAILHVEYTEPISGPDAPTNVAAQAGIEKNTITWDDVVDAVSYNLYWLGTSPVTQETGTKIEEVTSPYDHEELTPEQPYYYVVTAVDADANESDDSAEVTATPIAADVETFDAPLLGVLEIVSLLGGDLKTENLLNGTLETSELLGGTLEIEDVN